MTRKCRICKAVYKPTRPLQAVCGKIECAIEHGRKLKVKKEKREFLERKLKLKNRSDYIKEAQVAFNAYIRERDKNEHCICCPKPLGEVQVGGGFDCGHYRSVGSAPHLRFHPQNANGQTKQCNRYGAGRAVDYRIGLIKRIGLEAVEALEADNTPRKFTIDELKAIKAEYRMKLKQLKAGT